MATEVGFDQEYSSVHFSVADARFSDVPTTIWIELKEHKRLKPVPHHDGPAFRLTGSGWISGLKVGGVFPNKDLIARAQAIAKALKRVVQGRDYYDDCAVEISFLASNSGQTEGCCYNFLQSGLLQVLFPKKKMNAYWDDADGCVRVPPTFGQEPIFDDQPSS